MSIFSFIEIIKEIQILCLIVFSFFFYMIFLSGSLENKIVLLVLIYGIIMFNRCKEMSWI